MKTLSIDFDGVIHSYTSGWQGASEINDPPVPGAIKWLAKMAEKYELCIFSTRSATTEGREAMRKAIARWVFESDLSDEKAAHLMGTLKFPKSKPSAWLTLDDRALTFTGVFPGEEQIESFRPWYKRENDLGQTTVGQRIYEALQGMPDGATIDELVGQVLPRMIGLSTAECVDVIISTLNRLVDAGYVQGAGGRYCAPGPKPVIWDDL